MSCGPKTPEGKLASSQNARRHGLTAMRLSVAPEDQPEFNQLKQELLLDVRPEGALENALFERLLLANWNLRRVSRYETQLLDETNPFAPSNPAAASAFDRLARYRRDLERSAHRALTELRLLQTERAILIQQHAPAAAALYSNVPLAILSRLTRNTDRVIRQANNRVQIRPFHKNRQATVLAFDRRGKQPA
jgi:hypothetical protein